MIRKISVFKLMLLCIFPRCQLNSGTEVLKSLRTFTVNYDKTASQHISSEAVLFMLWIRNLSIEQAWSVIRAFYKNYYDRSGFFACC